MNALPLALVVIATTALNAIAAELPDSLTQKLSAAIREHCPNALIAVSESEFTAKHGTMMFTVHRKSKTGEVYPGTYQEEGPRTQFQPSAPSNSRSAPVVKVEAGGGGDEPRRCE